MTNPQPVVHELAGGEIAVWVDGGIHIKTRNPYGDPVELGQEEARELAELLLRLADE